METTMYWLARNRHKFKIKKPEIKFDFEKKHWIAAAISFLLTGISVCAILFLLYACFDVEDLSVYYDNASKSFAREVFSIGLARHWVALFSIPLLFFIYYKQCLRIKKPLEGLFTGAFFAMYIVVPIAMNKTAYHEIFFPCSVFFYFPGLLCICTACVRCLYLLLDWKTRKYYSLPLNTKISELQLFGITLGIILLCWTPVLLLCYPGSLDKDTLEQLREYFGLRYMEASNPIVLTFLYGGIYDFGRSMIDETKGLAMLLLFQTGICSVAMSMSAIKVYQYTKSWIWYVITLMLYTVVPIWPVAVQFIIKDTAHTAFYLMFTVQYCECLRKKRLSKGDFVLLALTAVMAAVSRKAALYIILVLLAALTIINWKNYRYQTVFCLAVIVAVQVIINSILPLMNISKPREAENYSMPLQILGAYVRDYGDEITEEEKQIINGTLNYEKIAENYTPMISDPIKATYHAKEADHKQFWDLFYKLMKRHPQIMLKAVIMNSYRHFDPMYDGGGMKIYISKNDDFHHIWFKYGYPWRLSKYYETYWYNSPILVLFEGTGAYGWVAVLMAGYALRKRSVISYVGLAAALIPFFGLLFSHVNGLQRYGYPVVAVVPVLAAFTVMTVSRKGEPVESPPLLLRKPTRRVNPLVALDQESERQRTSEKRK